MNKVIDIKQALRVFHVITSEGQKVDEGYSMNGILASTDFDGYTVTLKNDYVNLDIFFHNKVRFDYSSQKEKMVFMDRIKNIDKASSRS